MSQVLTATSIDLLVGAQGEERGTKNQYETLSQSDIPRSVQLWISLIVKVCIISSTSFHATFLSTEPPLAKIFIWNVNKGFYTGTWGGGGNRAAEGDGEGQNWGKGMVQEVELVKESVDKIYFRKGKEMLLDVLCKASLKHQTSEMEGGWRRRAN